MDNKLERIHQLEEEAQRLAQAMAPLIQNGLPPRKLHRDNDIVGNARDLDDSDSVDGAVSNSDKPQK